MMTVMVIKNLDSILKEFKTVALIHDAPDVTEASMVTGTFDDDCEDTGEHKASLNSVCPHHSFHAALRTTHRGKTISANAKKQ